MTTLAMEATADNLAYSFGGHPARLHARPGDVIVVNTEDCFGGQVHSVEDLPSQVCEFPYLNPVTGPIFIEGAEVGDTLAVHFVDISPVRDYCFSSTFPHFGALTTTHQTAMLHDPLPEIVWRYDVDVTRGVARFHPRFPARHGDLELELPLDPMHGTVGVAPAADEVIMSITPGAHGGNMDTPELRAGVTAYFGVNVPGAMLALGDGHCRQGEGETCGTGLEAAMRTTIIVDLIKGASTPWPRLESDAFLMSTGSVRPLEDAFRISQHDMVSWTGELTGLSPLDSLQLVSQAGLAPVGNVVDTTYTMVAKFPKAVLGSGISAFDGMHARMCAAAAEYLAAR